MIILLNLSPSDPDEEDIERIDLDKLRHIEEEERRENNGFVRH